MRSTKEFLTVIAVVSGLILDRHAFADPPVNQLIAAQVERIVHSLVGAEQTVAGKIKDDFEGTEDEGSKLPDLLRQIDKDQIAAQEPDLVIPALNRLFLLYSSDQVMSGQKEVFALASFVSELELPELTSRTQFREWKPKLEVAESTFKELQRLTPLSKNPLAKAALEIYGPKLKEFKEIDMAIENEISRLESTRASGYEKLKDELCVKLKNLAVSGPDSLRVYASHNLLRLAVFNGLSSAKDSFVDLASSEQASTAPVFADALNNVNRVNTNELASDDYEWQLSTLFSLLTKIIEKQVHTQATQEALVQAVHERLINGYVKAKISDDNTRDKAKEAFVGILAILELMEHRFDSSLKNQIGDCRRHLIKIRSGAE